MPPATLGFAAYAAPDADERWLGMGGALTNSVPARWLAGEARAETLAGSADSFMTLREMAAAGQGRAVLPCVLGDRDRRLLRIGDITPKLAVPIWVASHPDLSELPRIRAVADYLFAALAAQANVLAGLAKA